jgi:regulatory protein
MPPRKRWKRQSFASRRLVSESGTESSPTDQDLYNYALRALARRPFPIAELKKRLLDFTSNESLVSSVIEQLSCRGYLDDRKYIEGYVHSRRHSKHYGRFRIESELRLQGLDPRVVEGMLDELYPRDEDTLELHQALDRKLRSLNSPIDAKKAARLYNYLLRRGFAREAVSREIQRRFKDIDLTD